MTNRAAAELFTTLALDGGSAVPLYRQLYDRMRESILVGQLASGARLPSTRRLAEGLGISRNTVTSAFEQLMAEGYLVGLVGAGTYVTSEVPGELRRAAPEPLPALGVDRPCSRRGLDIAAAPRMPTRVVRQDGTIVRPFTEGVPALDAFPSELWGRLLAQAWRRHADAMRVGRALTSVRLREAISTYLGASRGVRCSPDQVLVVSGSQQAVDLAARVLLDPGDSAWVEDPGYPGARAALIGAGARIVPVPVDAEGLDVRAGKTLGPDARLAFVTPSHQFPLGMTMTLTRRLALLDWAARSRSWILEDDYDSEYRYVGRPLMALQGLDTQGRVIYIGTFSKVMLRALRLGYLVVPPDLAPMFQVAKRLSDIESASLEQEALADFLVGGHFARHIRRMRALYLNRQRALVAAAGRYLDGLLDVRPADAGMQLVGWLPVGFDDRDAARRAAAHGVDVFPLSQFGIAPPPRGGLLLGYAGVPEAEIESGARALATALRAG